ncbi:hypothetical protein PTSG_03611 [Salpingoeca rosetta]|uniref:Rho-GAP domain-containing protein n=1 Tax=Salpingoeca rosetta (strain ATCC 50818 / BSB-021) TaxID=946362 RepID=F2U633_SALR5|nr:uncharacterized protein PTSG_03611 [Salpingoeca rosetta]EGD82974.1 hypothetical protein PTSG_03611 [Salpingoeca rosetta]|eukprot:XP_004995338.1 hypothetical protein PTSG_03611 [Salpingoeca rosetta]
MSLQSKFEQFRTRVGEFKGKLADRQKKAAFLDDGDQQLEHEVFGMRDGLKVLLAKEHEHHPVDERKIPLYNLGAKMMQAGKNIGDTTTFGAFYTKVGRLQLDLGQMQCMHNKTVHAQVHEPLRADLEQDFPKLAQARKKLQAQHQEKDAASARFAQACAKVHKQGYSGSGGKVDNIKEEMEEAMAALQSTKTQYVEQLVDVAARERFVMEKLQHMLEEQLRLHESACELIRAALPSLRELKDTAASRKVFGVGLPSSGVDPVLAQLAATINRDGLNVQGLFRRAGSAVAIRQLKADLNSKRADLRTRCTTERQMHAIANAFKMYLREMPDCLLTTALYPEWMAAARTPDHNDRLYAIQALLEKLPRPNFVTLRFLARFLHHVSLHAEQTKMEARNLGIVIGPNLGWPADHETNAMYSATDSGPLSSLCEAFITYNEWLFPKEEGELAGDITDPYSVPNAPPPPPAARRASSLLVNLPPTPDTTGTAAPQPPSPFVPNPGATTTAATAATATPPSTTPLSSTSSAPPPLPSPMSKPSLVLGHGHSGNDGGDGDGGDGHGDGDGGDVFTGSRRPATTSGAFDFDDDDYDDDDDGARSEEDWDDDVDDDGADTSGGTHITTSHVKAVHQQLHQHQQRQHPPNSALPPKPTLKPERPRPPARPPRPAPPGRPKAPLLPPKPGKP